ncbi:hypothetical protein T484DRAFT_1842063 [Baffinella frigidus]|nr:hypothetical protein T484DRAFT_1842063 [Cryptophyta sp. CCMP2293]
MSGYPKTGVTPQMINAIPTLLWFADPKRLDPWIRGTPAQISVGGMALSAGVMVLGAGNVPVMLSLWLLYHSIVSVGQRWYSFGWESQLLETGFLAMFLVPLVSLSAFPAGTPAPWAAIWALRPE